MPIINRIAEFQPEIAEWRRDFHQHPETQYDVHRTAGRVAELLRSFGVDEVVTGLGRTGVVGVIRGREAEGAKTVGLRADMDALPITENTGKPYSSEVPGKMHACGHDGHTAMLLGAAKYLAETRNFDGTVAVIFQPAEEGGAGGRAMIEDGLMERFDISEVYGMHNMPGLPAGHFAIRDGGMMASTDEFQITIEGAGGHAAMPHRTVDPVVVAAHIIVALQTLVSRNVDPLRAAVLSVTTVQAGQAFNVIANTAKLTGTVRTRDETVRAFMQARLTDLATQLAVAFGAKADVHYRRGYPVTLNSSAETAFAARVAEGIAGADQVDTAHDGTMGGEDFAYMLEKRPGAYIFIGNGDTGQLHTDSYDFNDDIIPAGTSYWIKLAESALSAR